MDIKIWVEMLIVDFPMTHQELTELLGVQPTEAENKGDMYHSQSGKSFILSHSSWKLESGLSSDSGILEHMEALLNKIRPFREKFLKICKEYPPDINIIIHTPSVGTPHIGWESWMIRELAEYNASMGIDLSVYSDDKND
jgi:hypothetical protein